MPICFARRIRIACVFALLPVTALVDNATAQQLGGAPDFGEPLLRPATGRWRFIPSLAFAYDSFGQSYTISDRDTLDLVDEASGRFVTSLMRTGPMSLEVQNSLGLGQEATRDDLHLGARWRGRRLELQLLDDLHLKAYRRHTDFGLSSDYATNIARGIGTLSLSRAWRLRLEDQVELARFRQHTRYNYDYTRHDIMGEIERRWGVFSAVRLGYGWGSRSVPDSTAIACGRHRLRAGWSQSLGPHLLTVDQTLERRRYGDPAVRSHYVDYQGALALSAAPATGWRLRLEYRAWLTVYDTPDSIYTNAAEHTLELVVEKDVLGRTALGLGPVAEFRRTDSRFDPSYNQAGIKGTISYLAGPRLWVQFSNEMGVRSLLAVGDLTYYSDYFYNWSTLYLSCGLVRRLNFDLFFSLSPESHEDPRHNSSTVLLSTALTWGLL